LSFTLYSLPFDKVNIQLILPTYLIIITLINYGISDDPMSDK